jgi:hypothetical protein
VRLPVVGALIDDGKAVVVSAGNVRCGNLFARAIGVEIARTDRARDGRVAARGAVGIRNMRRSPEPEQR